MMKRIAKVSQNVAKTLKIKPNSRVVRSFATRMQDSSEAPMNVGKEDITINKVLQQYGPNKVISKVELNGDEQVLLCRCWQSGNFPHCDGAHTEHNRETGDNLGPVMVSLK